MKSFTNKILRTLSYMALMAVVAGMSACSPSTSSVDGGVTLLSCTLPLIPDASGTSCIAPPPIDCPAPTVPNDTNDRCVVGVDPDAPEPVIFPGANEAILFYNRTQDATNDLGDPVYDGYRLHTWNSPECESYTPEGLAESWGNGLQFAGIDPNYGAYWILPLKEGYGDCAHFIIHIGTDGDGKELGGGDWKMSLVQDDPTFVRMNWTLSGYPEVFEYPIMSLGALPLQIKDFAAHWIDANTLVWQVDPGLVTEVRLHHSTSAGIAADADSNISGTAEVLTSVALTEQQLAMYPQFNGWSAYQGDWTADAAKTILKDELVIAAYAADGPFQATHVQTAKVLDSLYTAGDADANEATLGVTYDAGNINAAVWAPTAQDVKLKVFDAGKTLSSTEAMVEDSATGIWSFTGSSSLDMQYYRYEITVYHQQNNAIEVLETSDPYSVSLSTNGMYSQFVDMNDPALKPAGWEGQTVPTIVDPEDAVIYEGHVRDFSARDASTSAANRGKYLAFTETGTAPVLHLEELVANGLTHFHLMPTNDIATINEDAANIVDLTDTVADLCAVNAASPVCGVESDGATLQSVLESYAPYSGDAQALVNSMRGYDSFNWGYDPKHYNVPDGIYASDPEGTARILEMRSMVLALHNMGLRVVLDEVYNHTNSSGLWDNSVLDKVVPGYYHRRDMVTGSVQNSTCCQDTALENSMMDKLMVDSLLNWTTNYSIDGFRFDILSHGSVDQMLAARDAVQAVDPDNYFYGEGWYRDGGVANQANQDNLAGTGMGTFNDRLRDGIRNAALFNGDASNGPMNQQDIVKLGMAGTLADYVLKGFSGAASTGSSFNPSAYAKDPADVINYVSKHDDNTLWDKLQYTLPFSMSLENRVRSQNISIAIPLMSQGIPFLQMGGDMLRSKSMDRNTYDAGDWFNYVDFTMQTNNWNVGLPLAQDNGNDWDTIVSLSSNPQANAGMTDIMFASDVFKEFLSIRRDSKLFRLTTEADILARVGFHNLGTGQQQGVIVMSIDDGTGVNDLDPANDAIVVMINGSDFEQSQTVLTATGFQLHSTQVTSVDSRVSSASFSEGTGEGTFTVPAKTMAVFVKPQGVAQGDGLSAFATAGAPDVVPYGATIVYLRGGMNGWGTADAFAYKGNGVYEVAIAITAGAGTQEFKVASDDWSTVDYGALSGGAEQDVVEGVAKTLGQSGPNLKFAASIDATYLFQLNAIDSAAPILTVVNEEPFVGTTVFLRGGMNGWGTGNPFIYDGGRIYSVDIAIAAGTNEFKVASDDWSTVDFGAHPDDVTGTAVELGVTKPLSHAGSNLVLTTANDGTYTFILDMINLDPKLRVFNQEFFGGTPVFLRGGMNGWGTPDELVYNGDGTYTADITIAAGTYEFKVASDDWSTVDLGHGEEGPAVVFGVAKPLAPVGGNLSLDFPTDANYRFTVAKPDGTKPKLTVDPLP